VNRRCYLQIDLKADAGLAITAGVEGDLFGLLKADKQAALFSKNFVIFKVRR
jgi:hypothetical protein